MQNFGIQSCKLLLVIFWFQCLCPVLGQTKAIDEQATRLGVLQKSLEDLAAGRGGRAPGVVHESALSYAKDFRKFLGENEKIFAGIGKEKITKTLGAWLSDPLLHKRQVALLFAAKLPKEKRVEIVKLAKSRIAELKSSIIKLERQNGAIVVREYQKRQIYLQYKAVDKEYFWGETSQKEILESLLR